MKLQWELCKYRNHPEETVSPRDTESYTWRRCVIAGSLLMLLNGCASLPPIIQYANMAMSGITYVSTGKGPSDHAISYVAKKDCSLFRILLLKPVCTEVTADTNKSLIARLAEFLRSRSSTETVINAPGDGIALNVQGGTGAPADDNSF